MKATAAVTLPQQRTPHQPPAAELRYVTLATHRRHRRQPYPTTSTSPFTAAR